MTFSGGGARPAVDDDAAVALLERIVRIYSPSTREREVADTLVETMGDFGFEACVDPAGNAVGHLGEGSLHLVMLGHIDTVPGEIEVRQEGRQLYGRGSVDAKGPIACFVLAAVRAGVLPNMRLTVIGAVEEECATSAGAYFAVDHYSRPDYAIIGEPSGAHRVTLGYKGRLLVDYALERPMGHTAGPERGGCEEAVSYWHALTAWAEDRNKTAKKRFHTVDPSLRSINSSSDGLSESVEMHIGLRLPPGLDLAALTDSLQAARGEATVGTHGYEEPYRASKRNALTSAFLASVRAEGGRPVFVTKTGTSDMNVVGPRWACPIVAYGPGDSILDHTPQEHIDLDEYLLAIRILTRVLQRLGAE